MGSLVYVGLDVHAESIVVAKCPEHGDAELVTTLPNDVAQLLRTLGKLAARKHLIVCYEAGPTGFGLARRLADEKIYCEVVAPSLIPTRSGDKIKTDRRDTVRLARLFRAGELTPVNLPSAETEAIRDLERAREDAVYRRNRIRNQLSKFLLRHERRCTVAKTAWTAAYLKWLRTVRLPHPASQMTLQSYLRALDAATEELQQLDKSLTEAVEAWSLKALVTQLQALRGVSFVAAVTLAAELFHFARFPHPMRLMAFLGLVPSENSSGSRQRRGGITKTGNKHARRILVESAWAYRHPPRESVAIQKRLAAVAPEIRKIAWKAQLRLHDKYRHLSLFKGRPKQVVVTAVARELAGFVWAIGRRVEAGGQATAA